MKKLVLLIFMAFFAITGYAQNELIKSILDTDDHAKMVASLESKDLHINNCYEVGPSTYSLLSLAIKYGKLKTFQILLDEGADLNQICKDKTPLMYAIKYDRPNMAKILLNNGAEKNKKSTRGLTAYDYAKKYTSEKMKKILSY